MSSKKIHSISAKSYDEFVSNTTLHINEYGKPELAIVFVNADNDIDGISSYLYNLKISHIGAGAAGEISDDQFSKGAYSALYFHISSDCFQIYHSKSVELSSNSFGEFINKAYTNPSVFTLIATKSIETDLLIKDIQAKTKFNIPFYGGMAIDNLKFEEYTVFYDGKSLTNGIVAVVFNNDVVEIVGDAYSGWESLGVTLVVTDSDHNELLEIDGQPASDVFLSYFTHFDIDKLKKGEELDFAVGNHPIMVEEANGTLSMKSPIVIDFEKKSLKFYTSIPVGTKFKFCTIPEIGITQKLISHLKGKKKYFGELDGVIITSCVGRQLTLGPFFEEEVKLIYDIWKKPMTGFLASGEIGNTEESGISSFHNVSSIFTGFKLH